MNNFFPFQTISNFGRPEADSSQSRLLYEQVIRKNQQIMKTMLSKMTQLYNRQEQYENHLGELNQKLKQISQSNKNLHHEMRTTHLEIQKKQHILVDDIKRVKSGIRMPQDNVSHQEYLSSNFFKQHTFMINDRARSRKQVRGHVRNKTNFIPEKTPTFDLPETEQVEKRATFDIYRQRSVANLTQATSKRKIDQDQVSQQKKTLNISTHLLNSKAQSEELQKVLNHVKDLNQDFQLHLNKAIAQISIKQAQTCDKVEGIKEEVQEKLRKITKDIDRQNQLGQIDFEGLHNYLDIKVKQSLQEKVSKKYLQQSLINFQQALETELNRMYLIIQQKLGKMHLVEINDKFTQISKQVENWTNLNSLKIQNLSYNSTCKSTPFKINFERPSIGMDDEQNNQRITRESHQTKTKKHLKYCSSVSVIQRGIQQKIERKPREQEVNQQKWKKRVVMALGGNKQHKIRRQRA